MLDLEAVQHRLLCLGYRLDARVDEPGEAAVHGAVLDIFPAAEEAQPCRIEHAEGRIAAIRRYDPLTQRSVAEVEAVTLCPASEIVNPQDVPLPLPPGAEHGLAGFYPALVTLFDLLPGAPVVLEPEVAELRAERSGR
ncbi:hypothetical protein ACFQU7_14770 [Pseudoroseomonas wenyumeiae]